MNYKERLADKVLGEQQTRKAFLDALRAIAVFAQWTNQA